jgi:tetratricopeptide (TPR) repeat protein
MWVCAESYLLLSVSDIYLVSKTQIALEYAYRRRNITSCSVFWIHADSEARFTQDYTNLAKIASLPPDLKGEDLLFAIKQWIELQTNWVLVLDNADDLKLFKKPYSATLEQQLYTPDLLQFVPRTQTKTILWTSRDSSILGSLVGVQRGIEVGSMTDQEAWELFSSSCGRSDVSQPSEEERELLRLLEKLPLAIVQAGAYMRKTKVSIQQYLKSFSESESRQSNLLSYEFQDPHRLEVPNSVMHTWLISMDRIAKESVCSATILNTIVFFDNKGIPFELVKAAAGPNFSEEEILLAAGRLTEYSFLQVQKATDEQLPTYDQHRLVNLATRQVLTEAQTHSFSSKALQIMNSLFPSGKYETWESCILYLPHTLKALARRDIKDYNDRIPGLLRRIGMYYWEQGRYDEAERLQLEVLKLYKEVLGEKHPNTIQAMSSLASTWWQQGRSDEAEQLELKVLKLRKEVLGIKHPDTIRAMANLALTWCQQDRSDEAEQLELEVLELCKEVLGIKHPDTIRAMASLASTWCQQDRSDEAEQLQLKVLELYKEVLGIKHPGTISAMVNLASIWWQQGRSDEAEQLQLKALELCKEVLGAKHPNTVQAMANLASTWWQQGRSNEAKQLQLEVLKLYKEVLGAKHPYMIQAIANHMAMEGQSTLNNTDTRPLSLLITSSNNPVSTQQQTTRIKPHSRLGKWTRKLTKLGQRKNSSNSGLEGL